MVVGRGVANPLSDKCAHKMVLLLNGEAHVTDDGPPGAHFIASTKYPIPRQDFKSSSFTFVSSMVPSTNPVSDVLVWNALVGKCALEMLGLSLMPLYG